MALRDQLLATLARRPKDWIAKGEFQRMEFRRKKGNRTAYTPVTVVRTLQLMETESEVAVKYQNGHAFYHYLPYTLKPRYITSINRIDPNKYWRN